MSDASCSSLLSLIDEMDHHQTSQTSMLSVSDEEFKDICRICHSEGQTDSPLISPCYCSGSLCYEHNSCLQEWIKSSGTTCCEICKFQFIMETKFLPFWNWKKLKMTFVEQLLLVLPFIFHTMMIPSLAGCIVLMVKNEDVNQKLLLSNMWIINWGLKIIFGIALFLEIVFMVYTCKLFLQLFCKWRNWNKIIYVQNAPKISGTVRPHQQQADEFSVFPQLPTNDLTSEHANFSSPKESKSYNCQSNRNIDSSNRYGVKFCEENNTSGKITITKTSSTEFSLTSDYDHPLSEVVVVSTAFYDNPKTIADKIENTENDSRKSSLIASTDNGLVPIKNHKCPMNEPVETSTAREPVKGKLKKNIYHFLSRSHSKTHAEDKYFLMAQKGHS